MKCKFAYTFLVLIVSACLGNVSAIHAANDTVSCKAHTSTAISTESFNDNRNSAQVIVLKEEREASNQHDWVFYILNIIITSSLTLLINYLNSKFEIIKMQKEPSIDRLKTIAIEGIKTEKKIYTDLKMAQEYLSFQRYEDALTLVKDTSNYLEENIMDVKPSLYTAATDIISYITSVVMKKDVRSEQHERELFETY